MPETPETRSKWPGWAIGLTLVIAGIVLGLGGCMTFLNDINGTAGAVGAIVFVAAVIVVPIGGIWFLIGLIMAVRSHSKQNTEG